MSRQQIGEPMKSGNKVYDTVVIILTVPVLCVVGVMCVGIAILDIATGARRTVRSWFNGVDSHG